MRIHGKLKLIIIAAIGLIAVISKGEALAVDELFIFFPDNRDVEFAAGADR